MPSGKDFQQQVGKWGIKLGIYWTNMNKFV